MGNFDSDDGVGEMRREGSTICVEGEVNAQSGSEWRYLYLSTQNTPISGGHDLTSYG